MEYVRVKESTGETWKARMVVYPKSLNPRQKCNKISVTLSKLTPLFWDCKGGDDSAFFDESELDMAKAKYKEYCSRVDDLVKETKEEK